MASFVVVKGLAWGVKSYPLAVSPSSQRIEASNLPAAVRKAALSLADLVPKNKRLNRMTLDVTRV